MKPLTEIQFLREPYSFPMLNMKEKRENIDDYIFDDFEVIDYKHHKKIKMNMSA